ncbi:MAG: biotin/lipoyl-containing protein [Chloroflexota bacterium]|nr:acetyl-CoA carboxylase biotin carboxyl carrier protein subunit [Anaerolineae bacterium]HMM29175.1 acetyl-CoA carboxylase biotin carboxyl carrier protein subunit [Aggregatilineaceae bacterium]
MKVTVKVENEQYEIEIDNLYARPIVAEVDGRRYEVWLDETPVVRPAAPAPVVPASAPAPKPAPAARPAASPASNGAAKSILAPIPGVIVAVDVRAGDEVEPGQQVCVLEAMKMKNIIRAPRSGTIGAVRVSAGQHVKHHDVLMDYAG